MRRTELHRAWGQRIRDTRRERGVSLDELAAAVGLHRTHMARIETGEVVPNDEIRPLLARRLGMGVNELFVYPEIPEDAPAVAEVAS